MISGCQKCKLALVLEFLWEIRTSSGLFFSPLVLTENQICVNRPLLKFQSVPNTKLSYVFRTLGIKCTNHMDLFMVLSCPFILIAWRRAAWTFLKRLLLCSSEESMGLRVSLLGELTFKFPSPNIDQQQIWIILDTYLCLVCQQCPSSVCYCCYPKVMFYPHMPLFH